MGAGLSGAAQARRLADRDILQEATMMRRCYRRLCLFASIVGREWYGGRLTPCEAWDVAMAMYPWRED